MQSYYSEINIFLYTHNELLEIQTKKKIPSTTATRKIKYLGINLTKEAKDLYLENTEDRN